MSLKSYSTRDRWSNPVFPVALILGFLLWVVINMIIARIAPQSVLSRHEMMVIFATMWIVGMMPGVGWMGYFIGALPAPYFFASPENRWAELFLDELPHWAFPEPTPWIMDRFYFGLHTGEFVPWTGWIPSVLWWFSGVLAFMSAGFFVIAIFHRQWADAERLTYPLVNFPMDLMEGFGEGRALPKIFRDPVFWAGFAWTAGIIGWNIINFWFPNVPRITLFDSINTKSMTVAQSFPPVYLRVLPLVIGLGYLCSLDLLFQLLVLWPLRRGQNGHHQPHRFHSRVRRTSCQRRRNRQPRKPRRNDRARRLVCMDRAATSDTCGENRLKRRPRRWPYLLSLRRYRPDHFRILPL